MSGRTDTVDRPVSGRPEVADEVEGGRTFRILGNVVVRWPWLVVVCWLVLAAGLPALFPSLNQLAQEKPVEILPASSPGAITTKEMTKAFQESGSENTLLIVLSNENGLQPVDERIYSSIADKLRQDTKDVVMTQDFVSTPPLREVMVSGDGKAWIMLVGLTGGLGSPQSYDAYNHVAEIVKQTVEGTSVTANLTGPAATVADMIDVGEQDRIHIEIATAFMLLAILLIIYRNPITMMLPLITIGVSLVTAQGVVAGMGVMGLGISNQTVVFLTAMMAGAGTDYAVFLVSRYHDYLRQGAASDMAVKLALGSIGKVIVASAATVAVTFLGMVFTKLALFSTIGIALAVSIGVCFLAAVTLLPAILVLTGRRGWIKPRRELTTRFWRRSGIRIVRRPKIHLIASLIILAILASCASLVRYNYDDRKALPAGTESTLGYEAIGRHFSVNSTIPQYLFIESPHDLRTPKALADLEQMAQRVSQVPGIDLVRGITRPTGESLEQARLSYQAGEVGTRLQDASQQIADHSGDLTQLTDGAHLLASSLGEVRTQVTQGIANVRGLVDALTYMQKQFGGQKTLKDIDAATKLVTAMRGLGDSYGVNFANITDALTWAGPVVAALDGNPICDNDPSCVTTRDQLRKVVAAQNDGTMDKIADLGRQLQSTQDTQTLNDTADKLRVALDTATGAMQKMGLADTGTVQSKLSELQRNADTLASGSQQLADGVQLLVDQTRTLGGGLTDASTFLLGMKREANTQSQAGFYIPPAILTGDEFKKAAAIFISPDGHAARYLIQTKLNPFSTDAMDQVNAVTEAAHSAQPNTELSDAKISMSGYPVTLRDTRDYYNRDIQLIIILTIIVVFLILVALLRALVAPIYLIGSVVVSYLSALGIGVIVFQLILGQELHWSVPGLTFIILVAVGADYNLLLISRIRDESPHGVRAGVIRTVGSTGGVITAAGLIFAASMFGLLFASISTLVQAGFVVGIGILLDTFLVRTITVPSIAAMLGQANWWPSKPLPPPARHRPPDGHVEPEPEPDPEPETDPDAAASPQDDTEVITAATGRPKPARRFLGPA